MALVVNTNIVNDVDNYSLDAKQVKGGYGVVQTFADLANLPPATIIKGSLYEVASEGKRYKYDGSTWVQEASGGGGNVDDVLVNGTSVVDANKIARVSVPTKTSDITNDSGYLSQIDPITLKLVNSVLAVNTTDDALQDNTQPITSSGVHTIVGNINVLLSQI